MTDDESTPPELTADERITQLESRIHEIHRSELSRWANSVAEAQGNFEQLEAIKKTVSWRITAPLRAVRRSQLQR